MIQDWGDTNTNKNVDILGTEFPKYCFLVHKFAKYDRIQRNSEHLLSISVLCCSLCMNILSFTRFVHLYDVQLSGKEKRDIFTIILL